MEIKSKRGKISSEYRNEIDESPTENGYGNMNVIFFKKNITIKI